MKKFYQKNLNRIAINNLFYNNSAKDIIAKAPIYLSLMLSSKPTTDYGQMLKCWYPLIGVIIILLFGANQANGQCSFSTRFPSSSTAIASATNATFSTSAPTIPTWYQLVTTCANGPIISISAPVQITNSSLNLVSTIPYCEGFETLTTANNCDSEITLNLTIKNPVATFDTIANCNTIFWNTMTIDSTGEYSLLYFNAIGCDSIDYLYFKRLPGNIVHTYDTICAGDSVLFGEKYLSASGIYSDTVIHSFGCKDVNILHLQVVALPTIAVTVFPNDTLCFGDSLTLNAISTDEICWSNNIINAQSFMPAIGANNYVVISTNNYNCITKDTVTIQINSTPMLTCNVDSAQLCPGTSFVLIADGADYISWCGGVVNNIYFMPEASKTYTLTGVNINGCSATKRIPINVATPNTNIALSSANNTLSNTGSDSTQQMQKDGAILTYADSTCNLICKVADSINGSTLGLVTAKVDVQASVIVHHAIAYSPRWYNIIPTQQGGAQVTLYQTQADFDAYNVYASANGLLQLPTSPSDYIGKAKMRILKISNGDLNTGAYTYLIPKNITWDSIYHFWEITVDVTSLGKFYVFANDVAPLFSTLNLNGISKQDKNVLSWQVLQGQDVQHFELQLLQNNSFTTLALLTNTTTYFEHLQPNESTNIYRLIGVDKNNQTTISNTVTLSKQLSQEVMVYPNPTYDDITVSIFSQKAGVANIKLVDPLGKLVYETDASLIKGNNYLHLNMKNLSAGTYYLMAKVDSVAYHNKVIKF
jgi:Secretion system C-terminal sorting domain